MVRLVHELTFNIFCMGPFPSIEEVEVMPQKDDSVEVRRVTQQFLNGDALGQDEMCEVLNGIDKIFVLKLLKKGVPMERFGSPDMDFVDAMGKYKAAVMNYVEDWRETYEKAHGKLGLNMSARVAFALRRPGEDMAPRPLLMVSYIHELDYIFGRIPSVIREVSTIYTILFSSCIQHGAHGT